MAELRWYVAVLVFRAQAGPAWDNDRLTERQVRLLRAASGEEAYKRAQAIGAGAGHSYRNTVGDEVAWTFVGLAELDELMAPEPDDGVEVIGSFSSSDADLLVRERDDLAVFWSQRHAGSRARDLLE